MESAPRAAGGDPRGPARQHLVPDLGESSTRSARTGRSGEVGRRRSVAVIANVLPFAQENLQFLIPALEAQGIEVTVNESYPPDISDMTPPLTRTGRRPAPTALRASYPADSFLYMGQASELGIDQPFQFLLVGPTIAAFQQAFGEGADGIVTLGHWSPYQEAWPRGRAFFDAYVAAYGMAPDYLDSALAYMSRDPRAGGGGRRLDHDVARDHRHDDLRHDQRPGSSMASRT
ncbi:MAG: ABC transporter substrate-binding protein [Alphaproteobacteria bacterium]